MYNKINKFIWLGLIMGLSFWGLSKKVQAESFYEAEWIPNNYLKFEYNGIKKYMQAEFFRRQSDKAVVYCLEPFIKIQKEADYIEINANHHNYLSLTKKEWNRITLLAYYGYMYKNHTEVKWYVITQLLIWNTMNSNYKINFTDKLNGIIIANPYEKEIAELENLVARHNNTPDLSSLSNQINFSEKVALEDKKQVLDDYTIVNSDIPATIENNKLNIAANKIGEAKITIEKKDRLYNQAPILYLSDNSQTVFRVGSFAKQHLTLNINIIGPSLKIIKKDEETKERIKLANIEFKIKDLDTNEYLINLSNPENPNIFKTDINGEIEIPNLNFGKYAIYEESTIPGYKSKNDPELVELTESMKYQNINNNLVYEKTIYNRRKTGTIKVIKEGEMAFDKQNTKPLQNIEIGLYARENIHNINGQIIYKKDELIKSGLTNEAGNLTFSNLYLGKYYLKELKTSQEYLLDSKTYPIDLSDYNLDSPVKNIKLVNYLKKGQVVLTKQDSLSKKVLSGVKINIYKDDNTLIEQGITNEKGQIIINNLPLGTYYFEEIEALPGYIVNSEKTYFTLDTNNQEINIVLENDLLIEIPDTYSQNLSCHYLVESLLVSLCLIFRKKSIAF